MQFVRFSVVGIFSAMVHFLIVYFVEQAFEGVHINLSNVIGFIVAFPVSYVLQRKFTFNSNSSHARAALRFLAVQILGVVSSSVMIAILVYVTGLELIWFVLIGVAFAAVIVFAFNKVWVFT